MSRPSTTSSRTSFASKTTWEALQVESGEETEEEEVAEEAVATPASESQAPLSKSAIKKAKAQARAEKRLQEKAARAAARKAANVNGKPTPVSSLPSSPSPEDSPATVPKPLEESVVLVDVDEVPSQDEITAAARPEVPRLDANGDAQHTQPPPPPTLAPAKAEAARPPVAAPPPPAAPKLAAEPAQPASVEPPQPPAKEKPPTMTNGNGIHPVAEQTKPETSVQDADKAKKRQGFLTRTLWTFIMIGGFITLLLMGHAYMVVLVFMCQTIVYREVTTLFSLKPKSAEEQANGRDPWSKTLNWYFFAVVNYFLYGESIIYYFKHVVFSDAQLTGFAMSHRFISFSLYIIGFMGFVMSLKRGYLKQQFGLFCWVHMSLLLVVVSSHFIVNNILEGMIWFWVPASLVICNDCFAYIWGITVGRTPLFKLSPKKTVEGFVGAFFSTIVFGLIWGSIFMRYQYMICPVHDLGVSAFDVGVTCTPNPVFIWREFAIPKPISVFLSTLLGKAIETIPYTKYHFHLFFLSCFASLVAPFGGFFASGFKRAFDIKDFGHSIPGHGGMTDRMDCQFLMGVFTYVYYSSLVRESHATVGSILQMIVSGLTVNEQLELIADLKRYLEGQGIHVKL